VERITANLNEGVEEPVSLARAHHGSVSLEMRQQTEEALKEGRLQAVVATASLELGIDMGAVDLVCQVASPGNVARGLQRVGRAGHLVGQQSEGRLIPRTCADLLEQAVLAREMIAGRVEEIRVPTNCLDVLAQQLVALVQGGTIPDTGQYAAYTTSGVRIGELDEEFIYERRLGDAFLLGTNSWRVERIDADRVIVSPAEGALALVPFWRGEGLGRSA